MSENNGILLKGLDGSNPLAFLAALGTLRTLTLALRDETIRMSWEQCDGAWRPRVFCSLADDGDAIMVALSKSLVRDRNKHPTRFVNYKTENAEAVEFYKSVHDGGAIPPEYDRWIVSLTNDIHPEATSPLQLTRSDYFVGNLDEIMAKTEVDHLRRTLLAAWRYDDALSGQSLHIEPTEDRRHAYQWNKPSGDPNRNSAGNMLGANRLAIESFPMFLGLPSDNPARMLFTGWTGVRSKDASWSWPIWNVAINLEVTRSLLALEDLQLSKPNMGVLSSVGVCAAYRSRRILVEKTPNLTPATAI